MLEPELAKIGYELVELEFQGRGAGGMLRVYIDGPDGVSLEDCERVSRRVSGILDVEDPIPGTYRLEVSSPGFDRPLRTAEHFRRFAGSRAKLRLLRAVNGRKRFTGVLVGTDGDNLRMDVDGDEWEFPLADIERARLEPQA